MSEITLGKYLFERLKQVNVNTVFGLPGDFNLSLLDKIYEVEGMRWAGNANELNAAYAADGYARIKGMSCIITTFGVGELSALNGIAGSYAEHVGVLHVVGVPSISSQAKQLLLHHTLGNGDFTVFHRIQTDAESEKEVIDTILALVKDAKNPVILADACCSRHDVKAETKKLIDLTQFPAFVTPMDTVVFTFGTLSKPEVKEAVESADLILSVGALLSDFNTGSFSYSYKTKNIVEFHSDHMKIRNATFPGVQMKFVLQKLLTTIADAAKGYKPVAVPARTPANAAVPASTPLKQEWMWNQLGNFLQEGDIVIAETGTSAFGINQTTFPNNTYGISQVLWGSIGFTTGATLGAAFAAEEIDPKKRVILFIGDGSLQLTVQEISTMIRWGLKPYLFVLNNDGYTIEKLIHGPKAQYNEIQGWDHLSLLPTFGAKDYETHRVATTGEWDKLTQDKSFNDNSKIRMIEVMLPVFDAPQNLVEQAKLTAATNAKQ
ncbi:Pyruvate decarboxylase 1 [Fusarium oxysporum]|nr:Pyruvate decarboxylase 1 [Fusarium oxysporum]